MSCTLDEIIKRLFKAIGGAEAISPKELRLIHAISVIGVAHAEANSQAFKEYEKLKTFLAENPDANEELERLKQSDPELAQALAEIDALSSVYVENAAFFDEVGRLEKTEDQQAMLKAVAAESQKQGTADYGTLHYLHRVDEYSLHSKISIQLVEIAKTITQQSQQEAQDIPQTDRTVLQEIQDRIQRIDNGLEVMFPSKQEKDKFVRYFQAILRDLAACSQPGALRVPAPIHDPRKDMAGRFTRWENTHYGYMIEQYKLQRGGRPKFESARSDSTARLLKNDSPVAATFFSEWHEVSMREKKSLDMQTLWDEFPGPQNSDRYLSRLLKDAAIHLQLAALNDEPPRYRHHTSFSRAMENATEVLAEMKNRPHLFNDSISHQAFVAHYQERVGRLNELHKKMSAAPTEQQMMPPLQVYDLYRSFTDEMLFGNS